jgi:rod shape-determining protein MreC
MESVLSRYRNLVILVGVLFLQVLGLAVQVKRSSDAQGTRLIRIWAVDAITPMEKGLVALQNGSGNLWHNYLYLRGVRAENRELKEQIEQMRLKEVRLSEDAAQAQRLQSLLSFKEQYITRTVAAQVIGSSGSDLSRGIYIDKGSDEGVQPDMAVITAGGIVGKVLRVYPSTALVLMINDQSSGVGVILEKSRLQGVLAGTPNGEVMMKEVMSDEQVSPGENLLTSGGDQIFPKGLPVGTIAKVGAPKDLFLSITVKPSANLDRLEEVLVVLQKQEKQAVAVDAPRARAADILAQRLPSVPQQPAAVPAAGAVAAASSGAKNTAPVSGAQAGHAEGAEQTAVRSAGDSSATAKPPIADPPATSKKLTSPAVAPQTAKPRASASQPKTSAPQSATPAPPDADTPH